MSIQFLGMIGHRLSSETIAPVGPIFDRDYIVRFAQTHEAAGFDRLLVGHWSDQPDGFLVTALAGLSTQKIQYLLAHRPGFVSPTLAARKFATLEHLLGPLGGAYHQRRQRCRAAPGWRLSRPRPALRPHRRLPRHRAPCGPASSRWIFTTISIRPSRPGPPFARCKNRIFRSILAARRKRPSPSPANMPTSSRCGASRWRKPARPSSGCAPKRRNTSVISASASRSGRLSPTAKPKPGESRAYPARRHRAGGAARGGFKAKPESIGAQRLRATAAQGRVVDKRLWTGIAQLVGGGHNSTALVGTPEQVADALLDYYDLGVRNFLIRGFDPLNDAADYGRALLPIAREKPPGVQWRSAHRDPS